MKDFVRFSLGLCVVSILGALAGGVARAQEFDNGDCFLCHDDDGFVYEEGPKEGRSLDVDPEVYGGSVHAELTCLDCHKTLDVDMHPDGALLPRVDCAECHEEQSASFGISAHKANGEGTPEDAPGCAGCHGDHGILPSSDPGSDLHFLRLTETCGRCHEEVAADIRQSVHGDADARGRRDSPVCTDCHYEHAVQPVAEADAIFRSGEVCSRCHESERLNTKYGLQVDAVSSYRSSYHGLATRLGATTTANCASCHGYHLILNSQEERSSIHPSNLPETCGSCHPGATENFVSGGVHHPSAEPGEGDFGAVVNHFVRLFYKALIFVVIGFMVLHNFLSWRRQVVRHLRDPNRTVVRMTRAMRVQHMLLALSFTYLALSGFALAYPDSILATLLGSNEYFRRWSHRWTGVFMLGLGVFHVLYMVVSAEGRKLLRDFMPSLRDFADLRQNLRHYLGREPERARFARFGYPEKLEYWAVFWGTLVMGLTGLVIWMKLPVTAWFPRWVVDVAITVHFYEAVLAVLAIIVWHLYHVIFDPENYPMNPAWLDGKVTPEWMEEAHPLERKEGHDDAGPGSGG